MSSLPATSTTTRTGPPPEARLGERARRAARFVARLLALLLLGSLWAPEAGAQVTRATLTMRVDRTNVEVGALFRLHVEARVTGAGGNAQVRLPDLAPFELISRSESPPVQIMGLGGGVRVDTTTRYQLTMRAPRAGTFTLSPASLVAGGRTFTSEPLTIQVGGGAEPSGPASLPPGNQVDGMQFDPDGFIRTWVDQASPYVGQQVTVTVYLYSRGRLRGTPTITQEPTTEGFWVQDLLPPSRTLQDERQTVGNTTFNVYVLRRFAAFPLQPGELMIGGTALTLTQNALFQILGGGGEPELPRAGSPVRITVRPLPEEGRPPGDVHVGELSLAAELDRSQVATGDAVTLTVTATGRGAMEQVRIPPPTMDGLRVLEPEIRDSFGHPDDVVGGARVFRFLVVAERAGDYPLGPIEVPVFNATHGRYTVARAPALTLTAAGNAVDEDVGGGGEATSANGGSRATAPSFGPIHTHSELSRSHGALVTQPWFPFAIALGPLLFLGGLLVRRARQQAEREDPSRAPKRARKLAKKHLAAARGHVDADEPREFYAAVAQALKEALEGQLGHPVGSLTHPELGATLRGRGMDEQVVGAILDELEGCDFARFSAVGVGAEEMQVCLTRARTLIESVARFVPTPEDE